MSDAVGPAGRALVVRRAGAGASLTEQIVALVYRAAWSTPLHDWVLGGSSVPRLLAVPADPLPGNRAAGMALRLGRLRFRGIERPFDRLGAAPPLPADAIDYLHRFAWLRDLATATDRTGGIDSAETLTRQWLTDHGNTVREPAWRADTCAWRIVNCAAHAPFILSSADPVYRAGVLAMLTRTARHLDRAAPRAPAGHARLTAWAGVVAAGLLIPDGRARLVVGERALKQAIEQAVLPDGGIPSRAPALIIEAIALLTMLAAAYRARDLIPPAMVTDPLGRMVPALLGLTHRDGGLGAWQGTGASTGDVIAPLIAATGVRARPLIDARDWGYQRVAAGPTVLLADAAPPPPPAHAHHGCASTGAFELSSGAERIIVNCGGGALAGAMLDGALADALRGTAAHSTLTLADTNSTAILPNGRLGRGVGEVAFDRHVGEGGVRLTIAHDGYARAFGLTHQRMLVLREDGLELRGEDSLLPVPRRRPRAMPFHIRFHLGPDAGVEPGDDPRIVRLRMTSGALWHLAVSGARLDTEEGLWVDREGRIHPHQQLVIAGQAEPGGTSIGWTLRRID